MNHEKYLTHQPSKTCPICSTKYRPSKDYTRPTCGDPNCIREARGLGLPFANEPTKKPVVPKTPKKPKKEKPAKS